MPQRFLRPGITNSEAWNAVSWASQSLFIRLLTLVDDFGRYDARPVLLRSHAFPVSETITVEQVEEMCDELTEQRLIQVYSHQGKEYLQIQKWTERARCASKFPAPPGSEGHGDPVGMIYFIHAPERKRVKIGFTNWKVQRRLATLQSSCPEKLYLLACMEGTVVEERALHQQFHQYRDGGEWFVEHEALMQHASICNQSDNKCSQAPNIGAQDAVICSPPSPSPSPVYHRPSPSSSIPPNPQGGDGGEEAKPRAKKKAPQTEEAKRIAKCVHRKESTGWGDDEIRAFRDIHPIDPEDLELVEGYYTAEFNQPGSICRTELIRLLKHWRGEVDRARAWKQRGEKPRTSISQNGRPTEPRTAVDRDHARTGLPPQHIPTKRL